VAYLFDSNIFIRLASAKDPLRDVVLSALRTLRSRSETLCFTPQVVAEFWNVSTRPRDARGGLGLSVDETARRARLIEKHFRLLPDTAATYDEWRRLVLAHEVKGVKVHDAKLVASMHVHGVTHLLTTNTADFARYAGVEAEHPQDV
jgi:predicted nucleic acid-binding protein